MAYQPTDWKNREVERPRTFEMQNNPDGTITLIPSEGNVAEPGTPITAVNMNKIEQGIADAIPKTEKGQANGIAQLGSDGKVPVSQMNIAPPPPDASTTVKGIVRLSDSVSNTSTTEAATANAVNQVNSKLVGGTVILGRSATVAIGGSTAIAIGNQAQATGDDAIAVGFVSAATSPQSAAFGYGAKSTGTRSLALGYQANVSGSQSVAIGDFAVTTGSNLIRLGSAGTNTAVTGQLFVEGGKNFEIPHPHPDKKYTHVLRHGAVESPTAGDTLYRFSVETSSDGETVELQLPDYFEHLNKDVDVYVSPHMHFGRAFGVVEGGVLKVTCEKTGGYKALVIGTHNDNHESIRLWALKGVEREIGESWYGETEIIEVDEIMEVTEFEEVYQ